MAWARWAGARSLAGSGSSTQGACRPIWCIASATDHMRDCSQRLAAAKGRSITGALLQRTFRAAEELAKAAPNADKGEETTAVNGVELLSSQGAKVRATSRFPHFDPSIAAHVPPTSLNAIAKVLGRPAARQAPGCTGSCCSTARTPCVTELKDSGHRTQSPASPSELAWLRAPDRCRRRQRRRGRWHPARLDPCPGATHAPAVAGARQPTVPTACAFWRSRRRRNCACP